MRSIADGVQPSSLMSAAILNGAKTLPSRWMEMDSVRVLSATGSAQPSRGEGPSSKCARSEAERHASSVEALEASEQSQNGLAEPSGRGGSPHFARACGKAGKENLHEDFTASLESEVINGFQSQAPQPAAADSSS